MKKNEKDIVEVKEEKVDETVETVKEEQCHCGSECKCKKSNGTLIIVFVLLMFVCLIGGLIGGYMLRFDDKDKCATKEETKQENSDNDENVEQKNDEDNNQSVEQENNDESFNKVSNDYLDEIYNQLNKVSLNDVSRLDIITASDDIFAFDYLGAMYGNVTDDYKILSALSFAYYTDSFDFGSINDRHGVTVNDEMGIYVRKNDLFKIANKFYATVNFEEVNLVDKEYAGFTFDSCDEDVCYIIVEGLGGTGPMSEYRTKFIEEKENASGIIVIVESFFVEVDRDAYKYNLKYNHKGETYKTLEETFENEEEPFKVFGQSYDEMVKNLPDGKGITYEFNFNKEGKFVSVSKK